ncbi:hypothetical protein R3P38DRAFT_3102283 [Favolaschia claudopus]|uniref:F-box domain-containing protein n=1 Tax=Favolaschia claudopus TaxID=2862362 RepID=A0AAV9ZL53_9AGAR
MAKPNPVDIQELLDHCIDYLAGSTQDLISCSLVARTWLNASHSSLFRAPQITNGQKAQQFCNALSANPTLIPLVRELVVGPRLPELNDPLTIGFNNNLTDIKFTHLHALSLDVRSELPYEIRKLIALPTLCYLTLATRGAPYGLFRSFDLWSECSPGVQHLDMRCEMGIEEPGFDDDSPPSACEPIPLKSLALAYWRDDDSELSKTSLAPFDLSQIKALAIVQGDHIPWTLFSTTNVTVLALYDPIVVDNLAELDLSSFPNLTTLRLHFSNAIPPGIARMLSTIYSQHIQTISLIFGNDRTWRLSTEFDTVLASLPLVSLPTVELEVNASTKEIYLAFPLLRSKDKLRIHSPSYDLSHREKHHLWWRNITKHL